MFVPSRSAQFAMLVLPSLAVFTACSTPWPWRKPSEAIAVARPPTQPPEGYASAPSPSAARNQAPNGERAPAGPPVAGPAAGQFTGPAASEEMRVANVSHSAPPSAADKPSENAFRPAQTVAIVGNQYVLAGEVEGTVNLIIAINLPPETPVAQIVRPGPELAPQKEMLFRQQLQGDVQVKIGYVDFLRQVPAEKVPELQKRVGESFTKELETVRGKLAKAKEEDIDELRRREPILMRIAMLMKQRQIETLGDLDVLLNRYGSTLERQQKAYGEHKLSQMAVMRNIRQNVEISHEEMLAYYHKHYAEYRVPPKARWEQLTVRLDKFPSEQEAFAALAAMGNEVYLGGAALSAVAKRSSQEPDAEQGGLHEWTNRGSLASKALDEAIFSLPLNRLSEIVRDDRSFHIIRVLERTEESYTPFLEAQVGIKEKIRNEKRMADVQAYLEKVRKNINVWTIYDNESPGAR